MALRALLFVELMGRAAGALFGDEGLRGHGRHVVLGVAGVVLDIRSRMHKVNGAVNLEAEQFALKKS